MFLETELSRAPYTNPANLAQYQEYLQERPLGLPPIEQATAERLTNFARTALTELQGEGVVYSGAGINYTVEFPIGTESRNRLIFTRDSVQFSLADGRASISMSGVYDVRPMGAGEISIRGGGIDTASTHLSIKPNGQARLAIEPRRPNP